MALDLTYPKIIGSFGDLIGGIEWWNGQSPNKGTIRLGSVKDIDISAVRTDINISDLTSYKIDAIDINDKLCIQLRFWYDDHVTYGKIFRANAYLKNKLTGNTLQMNGASTGRPYVTGFLSGMDNGASGGNFFYVSPAMAATYKAKLCLITEYPAPTFADGFGIILLLPTVNTKYPATIQSWADITDNKMGDSSSKYYWETIPEGADSIYYPFAGAAREVLWVNDYVYFTNFLKQLDPDASLDEVIAAAKAANSHEFITKLPDSYNTVIGENGHSLSGGERQRVSIARAVLKNPKILILDEATSSLDPETEIKIQEALAKLIEGRTTIAIAHRLSTLKNANRLVVIEKGRIAEIGSHNELIAQGGIYSKLVAAQRQTSSLH